MWLVRFKQLFIISTSCFCYVKLKPKPFSSLFLLINASRKMVSDSHSVFPKYVQEQPKNYKIIPITYNTSSVSNVSSERIYNENTKTAYCTNGVLVWFDFVQDSGGFGEGNAPKPSLWLLQKKITFAFRLKVMPCYSNTFQMVQNTNICSLYHTLSFAEHLLTSDVFHEKCGLLGSKQ